MKSILSMSVCAATLAFAVPALAAPDTAPATTAHHHMAKHHGMKGMKVGRKTKARMSGDPTTQDLNAKSLAAARAGQPMDGSSGMAAPTSAPNAAPMSGAPTTNPANAPGGQ